jgi:hypothetical protein
MEKKVPFLPSIKSNGQFKEMTSLEVGEKFIDSRRKFELLFPDRAFEK